MRPFYFFIIFFYFVTSWAFSQEKVTSMFPMQESSLLWKIEGKEIPKGSYIFGTMHLIEKEYFIFPDKLTKLLKKTDQLVMELAGMPSQTEALNLIQLKEGSFFDFFTKEQTDSLIDWAEIELKMTEQSFRSTMSKMKPFVAIQLATQIQFMGKTESYEMTFEKIAKEEGIEIKGLETISQQMAIFDNLSKIQMAEMVMEGIRNPEKTIDQSKKMQELYVGQNIDSLFLMIQNEGGVLSEEQSNFLDERNQNWIPQIKSLISNKKTFIAVGAGHLGGQNGLIRLLEKEGYTLTPITLQD